MASHYQDEIQYCARCGISFLWSQEEQRRSQGAAVPLHCPGCRQLLPAAGRERGQVKWYNPRKQYGFLVRTGQPDLYVHRSALSRALSRGRYLHPGDLVEFRVEQTERGPAAFDVVMVTPNAADAAGAADAATTTPRA